MLAAQFNRFGPPDVIDLVTVPDPQPGPGEVLVAVEAASVNGHDTGTRSGAMKFVSGKKFPIGVGLDFVGRVTAIGDEADLAVGERVWGMVHPREKHTTASAAELVVVPSERVGVAPVSLTSPEAASLVVAAATAYQALHEVLDMKPGQTLLVRGASGGVGTAAVQLARSAGAHVTTIAGGRYAEQLRALGADVVLDRADATPKNVGRFDAVIDMVGADLGRWRRVLAKGGRMALVALSGPALLSVAVSSVHGSRRIRTFSANPERSLLDIVAEEVDEGRLRPTVASVRPLREVAEAHRAFESTSVLGKHVLVMGDSSTASP